MNTENHIETKEDTEINSKKLKSNKGPYVLGEKLGEGGFGIIYKAIDKKTKEERAIKIMEKKTIKDRLQNILFKKPSNEDMEPYIRGFLNEVKNMKNIIQGKNNKNEYACSIIEYFNTSDKFVIVMELCDDNLLNYCLHKNPLSLEEINEILSQLNNSFEIMVEKRIFHRALKLENILIKYINKEKTKFIAKLKLNEDSCSLENSFNKLSEERILSNIKILAPEILNHKNYNEKSDLWSLGVLIYVLAFKEYPYDGNCKEDILNKIKRNEKLRETNDTNLNNLIKRLLIEDTEKRLTWKQYFNHDFFN